MKKKPHRRNASTKQQTNGPLNKPGSLDMTFEEVMTRIVRVAPKTKSKR